MWLKLVHLLALLTLVSSLTLLTLKETTAAYVRGLSALALFAMLFAGMGMVLNSGGHLPLWVILKAGVWMVLSVVVLAVARTSVLSGISGFSICMSLVAFAVACAVLRPT